MSTKQSSANFNDQIIKEFRANAGKVGGPFANAPLLLLTTIGAKSGKSRTTPLGYWQDGDKLMIFASAAGADTHPGWFHNLVANPAVTVEVGTEQFPATATIVPEPERTTIYEQMSTKLPFLKTYQDRTSRIIPLIALQRQR